MKTEWHRYNLKRKVVELPPVTIETFDIKVQQQQKPTPEPMSFECTPCRKSFSSEGAFNSHTASKKHRECLETPKPKTNGQTQGENSDQKQKDWKRLLAIASDEAEIDRLLAEKMATCKRFTIQECLFCTFHSESFEASLEHMALKHSFFIPDLEHLTDTEGIIKYLGDKITVANVCIYCNGKGRALHSTEAVQAHMVPRLIQVSKSHCKFLLYEDETDEYDAFYTLDNDANEWQDVSSDISIDQDTDSDNYSEISESEQHGY